MNDLIKEILSIVLDSQNDLSFSYNKITLTVSVWEFAQIKKTFRAWLTEDDAIQQIEQIKNKLEEMVK